MRSLTRRERYELGIKDSITIPAYLVAINFDSDDNIAFLIRTAACFGIKELFVIGRVPDRSCVKSKSGSLVDYVKIRQFSNPDMFISYCRDNDIKIVSVEISNVSRPLYGYEFDLGIETAIVIGNETIGVPSSILYASDDVLEIPMIGPGFCLNASQSGTSVVTEYSRQFFNSVLNEEKIKILEV